MSTLTDINVHQKQVRVPHGDAREALQRVIGTDAVSALAKLRHGRSRPGSSDRQRYERGRRPEPSRG